MAMTMLRDPCAREPPYHGVDETLHRGIESSLGESLDKFADAAWGRKWFEMFPPGSRKPCNAFDPASASDADMERFARMSAALQRKAAAIMRNSKLAKVNPWNNLR
ncbi:MAG: hypothetical protein M3453_19340 [Pseudomonadota bacterium]|nr:hypothetical protein [Pseudomonadota bacterium]